MIILARTYEALVTQLYLKYIITVNGNIIFFCIFYRLILKVRNFGESTWWMNGWGRVELQRCSFRNSCKLCSMLSIIFPDRFH